MEHLILDWISQYGYIAIFALLMFGIIGLPVPDETLLTFTGYLVFKGHLSLPLAFAAGLGGSAMGITVSYWLGRTFGLMLIHRYGRYLRITEAHVEKAHAWFDRIGSWSLTFGYFIPGVRHFTAYAAGVSEIGAPRFALFAWGGAILWVSSFIALGYFLGERWQAVQKNIERYFLWVSIAAGAGIIAWLAWRKWGRGPRR